MSNEASGYVWRYSPYRGATFDVHLAMGDSVNDQYHNEFWMTKPKLAHKARVSLASAKAALSTLITDGFVEILEESGGRWPSRYRFLFPEVPVVFESRFQPTGQPLAGSDLSPKSPRKPGNRPADGGLGDPNNRPTDPNNRPTDTPQPAKTGAETRTHKERSQEIPREPNPSAASRPREVRSLAETMVNTWWADSTPTPVSSFIGVVKIVERFLVAGYTEEQVAHALRTASCPTINAMLVVLDKRGIRPTIDDATAADAQRWLEDNAGDEDQEAGRGE